MSDHVRAAIVASAFQSLAHTSGSLGVGSLTLVHRLIELHGGRVSVHSDGAGRGSEFTIRLPLSGRD